MKGILWRWEEQDFGFRFRNGKGKSTVEFYQGRQPGELYIVPPSQRKLDVERIQELSRLMTAPTAPKVVAMPWRDYDQDWDWIVTEDGICLNYAGCLDEEEIHRREDEGVQRAMELVTRLVERPEPVPLSLHLLQQIHRELMGAIYPFAGEWRKVSLHKGDGPTKWPYPPSGIQPLMDVIERDVLSRSPVISEDDDKVFAYASEVMNELIAIHPFREGNGRTAFILGNLILMQNDMLPLSAYERRSDEARYFQACEAGRIYKSYKPLAELLGEWEARAIESWERSHG